MVDRLVQEPLSGHSRKIIWAAQSSIAHTEKDAILDLDLRHPAMWHFINPIAARRARLPYWMGDHARSHGGLEYLA